jgi:hypothetical protein
MVKIRKEEKSKPIIIKPTINLKLWPWHLSRHKSRPISIDKSHRVLQRLYWAK